jgi:carbon storage regulator
MLVLSRKVGEKVVIPDCGLTITVLAVQGQRVRLGITAPAETAVYREEVWHRGRSPQGEETAALATSS